MLTLYSSLLVVFAADSIFNWEAERNFKRLVEENPELVQAARRGDSVIDTETGLPKSEVNGFDGSSDEKGEGRKFSLVTNDQRRGSLTTRAESESK